MYAEEYEKIEKDILSLGLRTTSLDNFFVHPELKELKTKLYRLRKKHLINDIIYYLIVEEEQTLADECIDMYGDYDPLSYPPVLIYICLLIF